MCSHLALMQAVTWLGIYSQNWQMVSCRISCQILSNCQVNQQLPGIVEDTCLWDNQMCPNGEKSGNLAGQGIVWQSRRKTIEMISVYNLASSCWLVSLGCCKRKGNRMRNRISSLSTTMLKRCTVFLFICIWHSEEWFILLIRQYS